jgi:hypothetical protein
MTIETTIMFLLGIVQLLVGGYVRALVTTLRDMNTKLSGMELRLGEIQVAGRVAETQVSRLQNDINALNAQSASITARLQLAEGEIIRLKALAFPHERTNEPVSIRHPTLGCPPGGFPPSGCAPGGAT